MQDIKQKKYLIKQEIIKSKREYNKTGRYDEIIKEDIEFWTKMLEDYINCNDKPFTKDIEYKRAKVDMAHERVRFTEDDADRDKWRDIELDYKKIGGAESLEYYAIRAAYLR